jgi:hypothetical protein
MDRRDRCVRRANMRPLIPLVAFASVACVVTGCGARSTVLPELGATTEAGVAPAVKTRADATAGDADPDTYADAGQDGLPVTACVACTTNSDCAYLAAPFAQRIGSAFIPAPTCVQGRCEFLQACAPLTIVGPDGRECSPDEYGLQCTFDVPPTCRRIGSPTSGVALYCCPCVM